MSVEKRNVLFLCTGNSCRSQMAEGWGRALLSEQYNFYSAGIEKHGLNPWAVKAMAAADVDISNHQSNTLDEVDAALDLIVTVCGHAHETCPAVPSKVKIVHVGFDDPPALAKQEASEEAGFQHYLRVRDEIRDFIRSFNEVVG